MPPDSSFYILCTYCVHKMVENNCTSQKSSNSKMDVLLHVSKENFGKLYKYIYMQQLKLQSLELYQINGILVIPVYESIIWQNNIELGIQINYRIPIVR